MHRSLPPLGGGPTGFEERAPSPLPPLGHDISRPSSASTQASLYRAPAYHHHQPQGGSGHLLGHSGQAVGPGGHAGGGAAGGALSLPGLSALASVAAAPSPQARMFGGVGQGLAYPAASPTPTSVGGPGNHPVSRPTTPSFLPEGTGPMRLHQVLQGQRCLHRNDRIFVL